MTFLDGLGGSDENERCDFDDDMAEDNDNDDGDNADNYDSDGGW